MAPPKKNKVGQQSPTFLASGTGLVEDNFSMYGAEERMVQAVMRAVGSDGERQMKIRSFARRSPPAVRPGS